MALFGKDDKPTRPEDTPTLEPSLPRPTDTRRSGLPLQAHLGAGSQVDGKLTFEGSVEIDGQITGEIDAKDTVIIGDKAVVKAQITAGTVIVKGKVNGDVVARKRIELQAPARLIGNITTPSLVIHEGVVFEGNCSMGAGADVRSDKDSRPAAFPKDGSGNPRPQSEVRK